MVGVGEVPVKEYHEMNSNISIIVVFAIVVLILLLPKAAQDSIRVKTTHEGQFVPATGSIK